MYRSFRYLLIATVLLAILPEVLAQVGGSPGVTGSSSTTGTVNPNSGSAGAVANYAAAGGSTTLGPDATLTDTGTTLTYSGTNAIFPAGTLTNPSFQLSGMATNTGMYAPGPTTLCAWDLTGVCQMSFSANGHLEIKTGSGVAFSSTATGIGTIDTTLCRSAVGVVQVGSSTGCAASGLFQSAAATLALSTSAITANTCAAAQTASITGLSTAAVVKWSWASTPIGVTGYGVGGLQVTTFATSNTANVVVCNITASSITPGAMTLNLRGEL